MFSYNGITSQSQGFTVSDLPILSADVILFNIFTRLDAPKALRTLRNWLQIGEGLGVLYVSNSDNYFRRVHSIDIQMTERRGSFVRFSVSFGVSAWAYTDEGQTWEEISHTGELINLGDYPARIVLDIESDGATSIEINGRRTEVHAPGSYIIDSERFDVYNSDTLLNNHLQGDFPFLDIGPNSYTIEGATRVGIKRNTRQN